MAYDPRYVSNVAFTDLLFNIVVGLAFLFLLAFILMNPIAKDKDIEEKSDFIITLEWDDESGDDIDLWVRDPAGRILSFRNRESGLMHLDRDDLGLSNDKIINEDGREEYIYRNREVVSLRGFNPGTYLVNAHVYNKKPWKDGKQHRSNIIVELIKLNPYRVIATSRFIGVGRGQEFTAFQFTLDADGEVIGFNRDKKTIIGHEGVYSFGPDDTMGNGTGDNQASGVTWAGDSVLQYFASPEDPTGKQ